MKIRISLLAALSPTAALAHAGHGAGGFWMGAAHPLSGADHLLAMVAVGLLAAQMGGRAVWALPAAFVGAMFLGGAMGMAGLALPAVEPMILASAIILGALVALALRPGLAALVPVVALFGAAHGWAHGAEGPASGMAAYLAGAGGMTLALHLAGVGLGRVLTGRALRGLGGATLAAGLGLALVG